MMVQRCRKRQKFQSRNEENNEGRVSVSDIMPPAALICLPFCCFLLFCLLTSAVALMHELVPSHLQLRSPTPEIPLASATHSPELIL